MSSDPKKPNSDSDLLMSFIRTHSAEPPAAGPDEFQLLQARIQSAGPAIEAPRLLRQTRFWRPVLGGGLAVFSFILTLSLMPSALWQRPSSPALHATMVNTLVSDDELSDFLEDSLSALSDEDREWDFRIDQVVTL